jgi:hypothetical protein
MHEASKPFYMPIQQGVVTDACDAHCVTGVCREDATRVSSRGVPCLWRSPDLRPSPSMVGVAGEALGAWLCPVEHPERMEGTGAEGVGSMRMRNGAVASSHQPVADHAERGEYMAARAHVRFLRTVEALTDRRRAGQADFGSHVGRGNVGQQQINVPHPTREDRNDWKSRTSGW